MTTASGSDGEAELSNRHRVLIGNDGKDDNWLWWCSCGAVGSGWMRTEKIARSAGAAHAKRTKAAPR